MGLGNETWSTEMIPIYVISLANSERFQKISSDLHEQRLSFDRILAIDGKKISKFVLDAKFNERSSYARLGYRMSPALIGCGLSHKSAYLKGIHEKQDWLLILEEDVRLCGSFKDNLEHLVMQLDSRTPTVCQLFTRGERFVEKKTLIKVQNGRYLFRFSTPPGQTAGYLINKAALMKANKEVKLSGPPDWPNWSHDIKFMGTFPFMVVESEEGSTIGSPSFSRKMYWRRNLSKFIGWHFIHNIKFYPNVSSYYLLEIKPVFLRVFWKLKGKPTFPPGDPSGLWIV